jgi:hypothetical protein
MPRWILDEFRTLLGNPLESTAELTKRLPRRTADAIDTVGAFVHSWHCGLNTSGLSRMMLRELEARRGTLICSKCGAGM